MGAVESYNEGYVNSADDTWGMAGAIYYAKSKTQGGLYLNYRQQNTNDTQFGALTADLYAGIDAGELRGELEIATHYGNGDLEGGLNNITLFSFGAAAKAALVLNKLDVELGLGYAQGDETPNDNSVSLFQFNRDYNLALMMFEEPMPTLKSDIVNDENQGRDYSAMRSGYSLQNALYVRPQISYPIRNNLQGSLVFLTAWAASLPEEEQENNYYGFEVDAHLKWTPKSNFTVESSLGFFQPGNYYSSFSEFGGGFDQYAIAAQLMSTIEF